MIQTALHLRLQKCSKDQLSLFMLVLIQRMSPNFVMFCQQINDESRQKSFNNILNIAWEYMIVSNAKINFDRQLDKLEVIIPEIDDDSPYLIYAAIDACKALSLLIHAILDDDFSEAAIRISQLSLQTIMDVESDKNGTLSSDNDSKSMPEIEEELDIQWDIYRLIKNQSTLDNLFVTELRMEIKEIKISNIGVFLSN